MDGKHGMVWWSELMTRDPEAAKAYYSAVCGWRFDAMAVQNGGGTYWVGMRGEQPVIGIFDMNAAPGMDGMPPHWFTYFAVDDIDKAVEQTKAAGGVVRRDIFEVPNIGRIAILADPTGAVIGLRTPADTGG